MITNQSLDPPKCGRTERLSSARGLRIRIEPKTRRIIRRVEQAEFEPRNVVPVCGFRPTKCCKARVISYPDAHGIASVPNLRSLPGQTNAVPFHTLTATALRFDGNLRRPTQIRTQQLRRPDAGQKVHRAPKMISGDVAATIIAATPLLLATRQSVPVNVRGRTQRLIGKIVGSLGKHARKRIPGPCKQALYKADPPPEPRGEGPGPEHRCIVAGQKSHSGRLTAARFVRTASD